MFSCLKQLNTEPNMILDHVPLLLSAMILVKLLLIVMLVVILIVDMDTSSTAWKGDIKSSVTTCTQLERFSIFFRMVIKILQ